MDNLRGLILQHADKIEDYFINTETLVFIVLDQDLIISAHNSCFSRIVASGKDAAGKSILTFLLPESQNLLPLSGGHYQTVSLAEF
ncbi:MAG: hypothetical protein JEY99_07670 [Spirochaetales bacterium]|nr:hypothetical protein [Spirochaetales bacterium]